MAGEEFAWKMLKKGLDLSDEDIAELRKGLLELKDMAPEVRKRAELTEARVLAMCLYFKKKDPAAWEQAEREALRAIHGKG